VLARQNRSRWQRLKAAFFVRPQWGWRTLFLCLLPLSLLAVTLDELLNAEKMTPRKFAAYFKDFEYKFHSELQNPDIFLSTKSGDCDDYATLADAVLRKHGFKTRLISIRMPGLLTHVVCYVDDDKLYLDFNNRVYLSRTEKSDPDLREIAKKVAKSFEANWTSVSEFTYRDGMKELVRTVSKTDAYAEKEEPKPESVSPSKKIVIDF
jgi:soluble cytochrome b562